MQFVEHSRLFQYLATLAGSFSVLSSGINLGWTSPYLPQLLSNSSSIPTTNDEGSWCAVMPLVGAPVGAILAALLVDRIGRKYTILLQSPIVLLCFVGMAFADTILLLSILRFIIGSTEGALYTALPMYIGEISHPKIRGLLTSTVSMAGIIGTLFINSIGIFTTIYTSSLICALVPVLHFAAFVWMPESPYYHIKSKNYKMAVKSLQKLRGTLFVEDEIHAMSRAVERQEKSGKARAWDIFTSPSNRRACWIYLIVCATNKFSGKNPTQFYTATIFEETGSRIGAEISVIAYCLVELLATILAIAVVDRFGRRPLFIASTSGCAVFVFLLATYFYLKEVLSPEAILTFDWLPIVCLVCYNIFFSFGLAFGAVTLVSELFPTNVKGAALCAADTISVAMGSVASKVFQITKDEFGMFVPFWIFASCCVVGLFFIVRFVPETKGKSLEQIQQDLIRSSNKQKSLPEQAR